MAREIPRELVARGIRLRAPTLDDGRAVFEAVHGSLERLSRWLNWAGAGYSLKDANDWIASGVVGWPGARCPFLMFDSRGGDLLGVCGLERGSSAENAHVANLGYWVRADRAGKGYAALAGRAVARFGLFELGLERIEVVVATDNIASVRTAENMGARHEGVLRRRLRVHGTLHDAAMHSFTRSDFDR